ncbi:MAG: SGNH/GDSL hydrolase family protein, partial [Bdellovibrionales bacterium]
MLFIGNSYTFYNKLPRMVGELAKAAGERPLVYEEETPGGWSFKKHWESGKAVEKIREKKWDVVILQNHSLGALQARKDMFFYGRKLKEAIDKQGAKTLLYMTWARQNKPETQKEIASAYVQLGKELGAEVAPVGLAWQKVLQTKDKIALHIQDKSHPTKAGSYLAACVIY